MTTPLAVVPAYARTEDDLRMLEVALRGLAKADCDVLVVDDASPIGAQEVCAVVNAHVDGGSHDMEYELMEYELNEENAGFSRTVNVGLERAAEEGRDAVLVNADIEFHDPNWLDAMLATDAAVVGALLLYPNKTVQHAGIYFSLLTRTFSELLKGAPYDLPAAYVERTCPVTGALQLIRHEALREVGIYDEGFRLGWEDVSYCLDTFKTGRRCVYQPRAQAYHHESYFRGRRDDKIQKWTEESWQHFVKKHGQEDFSRWVYP